MQQKSNRHAGSKSAKNLHCAACEKLPTSPLYCEACGKLLCEGCITFTRQNNKGCPHAELKEPPTHIQNALAQLCRVCEYCEISVPYMEYQSHISTHLIHCKKCKAMYFPSDQPHDCIAYLYTELLQIKKSHQELIQAFTHPVGPKHSVPCFKARFRHECKICGKVLCGLCGSCCRICGFPACEGCLDPTKACRACSPLCKQCFHPIQNSNSCGLCKGVYCSKCITQCTACFKAICGNCRETCSKCGNSGICKECLGASCASCKISLCKRCAVQKCTRCDQSLCGDCHMKSPFLTCSECQKPFCVKCLEITNNDRIRYCNSCNKAASICCPRCGTNCKKERLIKCEICSCTFCNLELYWKCECCEKTICEECGEILLNTGKYRYYCKGCIVQCSGGCKQNVVKDQIVICMVCSNKFCEGCNKCVTCAKCKVECCPQCKLTCDACQEPFCKKCQSGLIKCIKCQGMYCAKDRKQCVPCGIVSCYKCVELTSGKCKGCNKCGVACIICKTLICPLFMNECVICQKLFGEQCSVEVAVSESLKTKCSASPYICLHCKAKKKLCGYCNKVGCLCVDKCKCFLPCQECKKECCKDCLKFCQKCMSSYCPACSSTITSRCVYCSTNFSTHENCVPNSMSICSACSFLLSQCSCGSYQPAKDLYKCYCGTILCRYCARAKCSNCDKVFCQRCFKGRQCRDCELDHCEDCMKILFTGGTCVNTKVSQICPVCRKPGFVKNCGISLCKSVICDQCAVVSKCVCGTVYCSDKCKGEAKCECKKCRIDRCVKCTRECVKCGTRTCLKCSRCCTDCKRVYCSNCKGKSGIGSCEGCMRDLCIGCVETCLSCDWRFFKKDLNKCLRLEGLRRVKCISLEGCGTNKVPPAIRGTLEFARGIHRFEVKINYCTGTTHNVKSQGFGLCTAENYRNYFISKKMIGIFMSGKARKLVPTAITVSPEATYVVTVDRNKHTITIEGDKLLVKGRLDPGVNYLPCFSFGNIGDTVEIKRITLL